MRGTLAGSILPLALLAPVFAQQPPVIRSTTQEVLLDVVVHDKKGRTVRDLEAKDFQVFDDSKPVQVKSFHLVAGGEAPAAPASPAAAAAAAAAPPGSVQHLRRIRLVTLVFERLSVDGRRLFKQAALDLLRSDPDPDLYVSIFLIDQRLHVVQPFTNDRQVLERAIDSTINGAYSAFESRSDQIQQQLETASSLADAAANQEAAVSSGRGGSGIGSAQAAAALAQMQVRMLEFSENADRNQAARSSIFALMGLVKEQAQLPGRKMVLYFSELFRTSSDTEDQFRALISAANRANVSVYAVDARGLLTETQGKEGDSIMASAANSSRQQQTARLHNQAAPVTPEQAQVFDTLENAVHADTQGGLGDLASSTGGFLISNTNDVRGNIRRAVEEVETYYEIAYTPPDLSYDGHFRAIQVKLDRPDLLVRARSGYFALPPSGAPLYPYELPLLGALGRLPLPHSFEYHAAVQQFGPRPGGVEYGLTFDVPLQGLSFQQDKENQIYRVHASLLALIKDRSGAVVHHISRDFPFEGPLDKLAAFQEGRLIQTWHVVLPPGRYVLDTAVADRNAGSISARRSAVVVAAPPPGLAISDLVVVRHIDTQNPQPDPSDPFQFQGGRVTPTLADTLPTGAGKKLALYFCIYTGPGTSAAPVLALEFRKDGKVVGNAVPALPQPDQSGRIPYLAMVDLDHFAPGQYEVIAVVGQGAARAAARTVLNLE